MQRRKFLKRTLVGGTIAAIGSGYFWLKSGNGPENLTIKQGLEQLDDLTGKQIKSTGDWNPSQIFNHLAQSIEYSMQGYPTQKSNTFKNTVGLAAFSIFVTRGEMTHGLSEAIPGGEPIDENNTNKALDRLKKSLTDFDNYSGVLKSHFAYGKLSKQEYTYAHLMHINNHFEEITTNA